MKRSFGYCEVLGLVVIATVVEGLLVARVRVRGVKRRKLGRRNGRPEQRVIDLRGLRGHELVDEGGIGEIDAE